MQQPNDTPWRIAFSTRTDGDLRETNHRTAFLSALGFSPDDLIVAKQVHGAEVIPVSAANRGKVIADADGLVYRVADDMPVVLGVRVADCAPVLIVDTKAQIIGAAHAGWRGTVGGIVPHLIEKMITLGADPQRMQVHIGAHIKSCCYNVPSDRAQAFLSTFPSKPPVVSVREGKEYLSLETALRRQLSNAGVKEEAVTVSPDCTASHPDRYFSYRADTPEKFGEQMAFVGYKQNV